MKRLITLLFFYFSTVFLLKAQTESISGMVINGEDESPLSAASVFINNSSKGTTTDSLGKFSLPVLKGRNFELVVTYAGFNTATININATNITNFQTIKIFPKSENLEEVSILIPEKNGWSKWGKFFTEVFIGKSEFASQCLLKNPSTLRFYNDKNSEKLIATAREPLIIENDALGYLVKFQLEKFEYDFTKRIALYTGYSLFDELGKSTVRKRSKWRYNRREAFSGSIMQFFRSVYNYSTYKDGFEVHEKIRILKADPQFEELFKRDATNDKVTLNGNIFFIRIPRFPDYKKRPDYLDLINLNIVDFSKLLKSEKGNTAKTLQFENLLDVTYHNALAKYDYLLEMGYTKDVKQLQHSDVKLFHADRIEIEKDGSYVDPSNILSSGYWAWCKVAEALPFDFED
ncbi:MAG: carboxypeptidase-like regulatory domain-containing protein [Bacteroidetes bacterium]|nr:carboxypeptidase-like regulatory domain-containing protein [Bacteroidota bacterium]